MLSTTSPEFIAFVDDLVERVLRQMCRPARGYFVALTEERIIRITAITNGTPAETRASIRRLSESGRFSEETRRINGRTVYGVAWTPPRKKRMSALTVEDREFLKQLRVAW